MHHLLRLLTLHQEKLETLIVLLLVPITAIAILIQVPFGLLSSFALSVVLLLGGIALIPSLHLAPKRQPSRLTNSLTFLSRSAARMYGRLRLP